MHYILIAQDRHAIDCFTRLPEGNWILATCQGLDEKVQLDSIASQLAAAEVYDKVVFTQ